MVKSLACFIFIAGVYSRIIFISRIYFLAKPQRALRPTYPQRSLGVLRAFARASFLSGIFLAKLSRSLRGSFRRNLCVLRAFARERNSMRAILSSCGINFLAKPPRALRPIYPCGAFASSAPLREKETACE